MKEKKAHKRCVVLHSHFYQPPRENPWTGEVEKEPSARPAHDWNERIAHECYIPNGVARINDHQGRILELVNNYEYLNFNFGPTLLSWYESAFPGHYARIFEGFRRNKARLGHPNAIAQAYNHMIMPLAPFRDQLTQVLWGVADFEHRFKCRPEAMWLPETACNPDTLRLLIDQKMKYVILAPNQAEKARKIGSEKWIYVSNGDINPKRPYLWRDRTHDGTPIHGRSIAIFFYDGPASRAVAFDGVLKDSASLAERIASCFDADSSEDQIVSLATDGESYGHHHKFADMTLAHLFRHELKKRGMELTNYSAYLEDHPPSWEAEIKPGPNGEGTSWSCGHGVGRWKTDCGCGREGMQQLKWRAPLRTALDWLRDALTSVYEEEGGEIFTDPWSARNDYIRVILDRSEKNVTSFLKSHCKPGVDEKTWGRALSLLELQRNSMLMFTSCGWFFSDISRIETVQNLKYASMAIRIARGLGFSGLEKGFITLLEAAPSNAERLKNGMEIYEKLVKPAEELPEHTACAYAMKRFLSDSGGTPDAGRREVTLKDIFKKSAGDCLLLAGTITLRDSITLENLEAAFCCAGQNRSIPETYVSLENPRGKFSALSKRLDAVSADSVREGHWPEIGEIMGCADTGLSALSADDRESILDLALREKSVSLETEHEVLFRQYQPLAEQWLTSGEPVPEELASLVAVSAVNIALRRMREFAGTGDRAALDYIHRTVEKSAACGAGLKNQKLEKAFKAAITSLLGGISLSPSKELVLSALSLISSAKSAKNVLWVYEAQNTAVDMLNLWTAEGFPRSSGAQGDAEEIISMVKKLCMELGILADNIRADVEKDGATSATHGPHPVNTAKEAS